MKSQKKMYYAECKTAYGIKLWKSESKVCRDNFVKHSMGFAKAISEKDAENIKEWNLICKDE